MDEPSDDHADLLETLDDFAMLQGLEYELPAEETICGEAAALIRKLIAVLDEAGLPIPRG